MARMFGTDGVRGKANTELTPEMAMQIGRAGAYALAGSAGRAPKVMIGTDTRRSADMLEAALVAGLCSVGAKVYLAGVVPSPAMAHLVRQYELDAGIMLSASHNPMPDNGIKFFDGKGYKLSDSLEDEIEALCSERANEIPRPVGIGVGHCFPCESATEDYVEFLLSTITGKKPFAGLRIALDCANGATYQAAPIAFRKLGAEVFFIHSAPDGSNINEGCGSTHLGSLRDYVKARGLDIGLAFDGDGDRMLCVDDTGAEMDGDVIMAVCGLAMQKKGNLNNNAIVATVMSNMGLQLMCREQGITLHQTSVGDRYVIEKMREGGYNLGGEQSGHIIFGDYNTTGDGILTGLQLLAILKESGQKMSELRRVMEPLPQVLLNAELSGRNKYVETEPITNAIAEADKQLAGEGRILVRPSGTEPLVRVMIEGREQSAIDKMATELVTLIEKELS